MKTCFKCGDSKPLTEFYTHPRMADGHLNKCKVCTRIDSNAHRDSNLEKVREYDRRRATAPERISINIERTRNYRRANPQKAHAHLAVARALRSGRLVRQPCSVCGCEKSEAHHADYSKPLDVMWLCSLHHKEQHRRERMDLVLRSEVAA